MNPPSAEFLLAAACCRRPANAARAGTIRSVAERVDWVLFLAVCRRHRVEGLVHAALRAAAVEPEAVVSAELSAAAAAIARQNLALAAESLRLRNLFDHAALPLLFVKGVTLSALAYGSIGQKMGWDVDVLVPPDRVGEAAALMSSAGYDRIVPGVEVDERRFLLWHRHWKESVWRHRTRGFVVELHTSLVDNPMLLPGISTSHCPQVVEVAKGLALPTLGPDELFAYLAVHGASSGWSRLKWIADFAALISQAAPDEVERLYRRSQALGAGRAPGQALLLARWLFEVPLPDRLHAELIADRGHRILFRAGVRALTGRYGTRELHETWLGTLPVHLMQFLLLPSWRFKLAELGRQTISPYDRVRYALPRPLHFLYPLLVVPGWLARKRRERLGL